MYYYIFGFFSDNDFVSLLTIIIYTVKNNHVRLENDYLNIYYYYIHHKMSFRSRTQKLDSTSGARQKQFFYVFSQLCV